MSSQQGEYVSDRSSIIDRYQVEFVSVVIVFVVVIVVSSSVFVVVVVVVVEW